MSRKTVEIAQNVAQGLDMGFTAFIARCAGLDIDLLSFELTILSTVNVVFFYRVKIKIMYSEPPRIDSR
jgi:hypothetical protein